MTWKRTGRVRQIERTPYDPILAADTGRALAYSSLDDTPLPKIPPAVPVEQHEWRCGDAVEWRDA